MDSLQVKVFFFNTQRPKSTVAMHTRMQRAAEIQREERQRDRKIEKGSEKPLRPGPNTFPGLKMGLIPLCPVVLPHFGRPLPFCEEETASYLHQITFLYTPPHWPYHEAYPESGAQRSRSHRLHPFRVSIRTDKEQGHDSDEEQTAAAPIITVFRKGRTKSLVIFCSALKAHKQTEKQELTGTSTYFEAAFTWKSEGNC